MITETRNVQTILTPQKKGFLASAPYPFTHTLSPYTGCGFGNTACGQYCYAQFMPNWTNFRTAQPWGGMVSVKENAPTVLNQSIQKMKSAERAKLRIFMASTTDPYQPLEAKHQITRQCLDVFAQYSELDLLVIQTRSPLVERDFKRIQQLSYSWLSVTIETDDPQFIWQLGGGPIIQKRLEIVRAAAFIGIHVQIVVSPCLPYTTSFAEQLATSGAERIIIDNFIAGDGSGGKRTASSPFGLNATYNWRDSQPAHVLYDKLQMMGLDVGWSAAGFCGIKPRHVIHQPALL